MVIFRKEKFKAEKSVLNRTNRHKENGSSSEIDLCAMCKETDMELGVAVDIGTTSIAVGVFETKSDILIGNKTQINCQTAYGSDVMMRIMHCVNGKEQLLHDMLIEQIEGIIGEILSEKYEEINLNNKGELIEKKEGCIIKKMVVVGNTTMCHIFLNEDVTGLKGAPFHMAYEGIIKIKSQELGFNKYDIPNVVILPNIKAHVGADAAAVICSQKMYKDGVNELAIDIGTNAEIILNKSGEVFAASTAAGPAFEGKGIMSGMRAAPGAINSVKISRVNGNIILGILDEGKEVMPKGICGSGLIDAVAELIKARLLTKSGYLLTKKEAEEQSVNINLCNCLDNSDETRGNCFILSEENGIVITQKDIRNVQLAKAAIQAGTEVLLDKAGISMKDIDSIKIAGVFGKHIKMSSAVAFGLIPDCVEKIEFIGNAAGEGAAMALFDEKFVTDMEEEVKKVKHIELANEKDFQSKFLNAMELKEWYYN